MKAQTKLPLRFTYLHLENWRNFTTVEASLQQRVFLVGPNASGKSNFLDVFRFLHDIVSVGGGFQEAVRRRGGVSALRSLAARGHPDIVLRVKIGEEEQPALWEYELQFSQENQRRPSITRERVVRDGHELLLRPDARDTKDRERLTQTHLEQVNANQLFREVVEFFESVRYRHIVPQLVREPERFIGQQADPYGSDFVEQVASTPERERRDRLRQIQKALSVAVPQLTGLELRRDRRGTPHLRGRYEHWQTERMWQTEDHFSDGTLRLLGLLWATLDGSGPLLLEEPELGLHPAVVRYLPAMFARTQSRFSRQIMMSSHSPDLLADEGIGLDEVLLLEPDENGTTIHPAADFVELRALLTGGLSLGEAVMPRTEPRGAHQLALFGE